MANRRAGVAALLLLLALGLDGAAAGAPSPLALGPVQDVYVARGEITGFAVDGDRFAVVFPNASCSTRIRVGRLGRRPVAVSRGPCYQEEIAELSFSGGRALWREVSRGNYGGSSSFLTAADTDPRVFELARDEAESSDPAAYRLDVRMGSGGAPLLFFDEYERRLSLVRGRGIVPSVSPVDFPVAVHAKDGVITAITEKVGDGPTRVERLQANRRLRPPFRTRGVAIAVAGSRERVATIELMGGRTVVALYDPRSGRLLMSARVSDIPEGAEPRLAVAGPWIAFDGGTAAIDSDLTLVDTRSKSQHRVANVPAGFGLTEARLIWAETGYRIRAIALR